jgi:transposase
MTRTPDLSRLTEAQKDALIVEQAARLRRAFELIATLERRIEELEKQLGKPPKTPRNSSTPPSQGNKANAPKRDRKRRRGRPGVARTLEASPDAVVDAMAETCPHCAAALSAADQKRVQVYDRIEIPPIRPIVTRVHLHGGTCPCCRRSFTAPVAPGLEPGSPFGRSVEELVVFLHYTQAVSYVRLASMMDDVFGVTLSEGAIANMLARARGRFLSEAATITETVKSSPVICSDETSARVEGRNWWEWVFVGEGAVLHHIVPSRAKAVVTELMDGVTPLVWVSDLYGAQQGHGRDWQVCLAHQLRDVQYAIDDGDNVFSPRLRRLLLRAISIGRRRDRLKDNTLRQYASDLERRLDRIITLEPRGNAGHKIKRRMMRIRAHLFVFVTNRAVPATNNISERALRPSVIFRKITNGFRSTWGADLYAAIRSTLSTGRLQGLSALQSIRRVLAGQTVIAAA